MKRFFTASRMIAISFAALILLGTCLLMLPVSSATWSFTPFIDALFTAASASCVTGLSVCDTLSHWSGFGHLIIISLIQIGGIGCMTVVSLIIRLFHAKVSMRDELMLMQAAGILNRRDVLSLVRKIIRFTLSFELAGALLLSIRWVPALGFWRGVGSAIFTSVSAFCNAGFDLFGDLGTGSLSYFSADGYTLAVISLLIICGGLGFIVWSDLIQNRFRFKRLQFHSKVVLAITATLLLLGTGFFCLSEMHGAFSGMQTQDALLSSFFQSVTTRTAGFYAFPQAELSTAGIIGSILLMCIGGSPGSTAGGIKTTTILVILLAEFSTVRKNREITLFRKRLDETVIRQANSIVVIYLSLILVASCIVCVADPVFSLSEVLFETCSAVATVGLSLGITANLSVISKIVITLLMYIGRIGGLTFAFMLSEKRHHVPISRPVGEILIG